jgi:hypothetical protein
MTRYALRLALATVAVFIVLGSATAYAGYPNTVKGAHNDCGAGHDPLHGHYSAAVLEKALATLSGSDTEYTNCVDAIRSALRALIDRRHPGHPSKGKSGGGTKTTTTGTSTTVALPSSVIRQTLHAARAQGKLPKNVNGITVTPGAVANSGFLNTIPTPLLIVLAALGAMLLAVGAYLLRTFVRARRTG